MECSRKGGLCGAPSPWPRATSHRSHHRGDLASSREPRALGPDAAITHTDAAATHSGGVYGRDCECVARGRWGEEEGAVAGTPWSRQWPGLVVAGRAG